MKMAIGSGLWRPIEPFIRPSVRVDSELSSSITAEATAGHKCDRHLKKAATFVVVTDWSTWHGNDFISPTPSTRNFHLKCISVLFVEELWLRRRGAEMHLFSNHYGLSTIGSWTIRTRINAELIDGRWFLLKSIVDSILMRQKRGPHQSQQPGQIASLLPLVSLYETPKRTEMEQMRDRYCQLKHDR
jgi:hypothetical protein